MIKEVCIPEIYITNEIIEKLTFVDGKFKANMPTDLKGDDFVEIEDADLAARTFYYNATNSSIYEIDKVFDLLGIVAEYIENALLNYQNCLTCYCLTGNKVWSFGTIIKVYEVYSEMILNAIHQKKVDAKLVEKLCEFTSMIKLFDEENEATYYQIDC